MAMPWAERSPPWEAVRSLERAAERPQHSSGSSAVKERNVLALVVLRLVSLPDSSESLERWLVPSTTKKANIGRGHSCMNKKKMKRMPKKNEPAS